MKIFVTGGAGFIGNYLTTHLVREHQVTIYDDLSNSNKERASELTKLGVNFIQGDVLDYNLLVKSSKNCELVIHLAAISDVTFSLVNPELTQKVNVIGTINVLRCCVENKIKKIIFASSAAIYDDGEENLSLTENSKVNPASPYAESKLKAENEITKFAKINQINFVILRIFNVYGKGQNEKYAGVISNFVKNIKDEKPLVIYGDGLQTRDFISIYDVITAFDLAISLDVSKTFNIASGKSTSINELVMLIIKISGKKLDVIYKKQKLGEIRNSVANIKLAKNELGFNPGRNFEEELFKLLSN